MPAGGQQAIALSGLRQSSPCRNIAKKQSVSIHIQMSRAIYRLISFYQTALWPALVDIPKIIPLAVIAPTACQMFGETVITFLSFYGTCFQISWPVDISSQGKTDTSTARLFAYG
ncbi:MAG: hypothetical protein ACYSTR_05295 [Planctomycetota bacterium]|jgi:hypothetical protein